MKTKGNATKSVTTTDVTNVVETNAAREQAMKEINALREKFGDSLIAMALPATLASESVSLHTAEQKREIEVLRNRNIELDELIEGATKALREEKERNIMRLAELNAKEKSNSADRKKEDLCQGSDQLGPHIRHRKDSKFANCIFNTDKSEVTSNTSAQISA